MAVDNNEGVYYTTHAFPEPGGRLEAFLTRFEEEKGGAIENGSFGGLAADAVLIAIEGYLTAGNLDGPAIAAAIAEIEGLETVTGTTTYAGTDGVPDRPVYIHQIVDGTPTLAATIGG